MTPESKILIEANARETLLPFVPEGFELVVSLVKVKSSCEEVTASIIQALVLNEYGVSKELVLSGIRKTEVVMARKVICSMIKKYTSLSLANIAKYVGLSDHTGVLHCISDLRDYMQIDSSVRSRVSQMELIIQSNVKF